MTDNDEPESPDSNKDAGTGANQKSGDPLGGSYGDAQKDAKTNQCKTGKACEPVWPLALGSIVPSMAVLGYFYLLWTLNTGSFDLPWNIPFPIPPIAKKAFITAVIWYGIVDIVYCVIAYLLDLIAVGAFAKRSFARTVMLTYSLRAWKLTGFLLTFAGVCFLMTTQPWLASAVILFIGLIASFLAAVFVGSTILELVHKVTVSKWMFFTFMATEWVAYGATAVIATMIIAAMPKWF